jgi:hypothetical protein
MGGRKVLLTIGIGLMDKLICRLMLSNWHADNSK